MSEITRDPGHGMNYWRSLQELADSDEYRHLLDHEFPGGIDAPDGMSRRRFLQIMSASIAMTTLAGCRWPVEKIVPFAANTPGVVPGTPLKFATTMELGPVALSVLATSYDGRPIKIDGNPDMPLSGGATSAFAQASVLDLYNPDRSRTVQRHREGVVSDTDWATFTAWAAEHLGGSLDGVAVLTGATTSPSVLGLLERAGAKGAGIYLHEPVCRRNEIEGAAKAFGTTAMAQLDLSRADVIVDFDANCLQDHPTALRNASGSSPPAAAPKRAA